MSYDVVTIFVTGMVTESGIEIHARINNRHHDPQRLRQRIDDRRHHLQGHGRPHERQNTRYLV